MSAFTSAVFARLNIPQTKKPPKFGGFLYNFQFILFPIIQWGFTIAGQRLIGEIGAPSTI